MMMRCRLLLVLFGVFFILLAGGAEATLVRPMNLDELVGDAHYIIKAEVKAKDTRVDSEESGMIVTYYTLKVKEYLKGSPVSDDELVIKQVAQGEFAKANGRRYRQNLYFPEYAVGRTYLLFLPEAHARTGLLAPVGLQQGVYDIVTKNGEEELPQLKSRRGMLVRNLSQKNPHIKFLNAGLAKDNNDNSYNSFKKLVQTAGVISE